MQKNVRAVSIGIKSEEGANAHAFAAILPDEHRGVLGNDMEKWDEKIIICDPWSNISCSAPKFKKTFLEKMSKWESNGKEVVFNGEIVPANDIDWVNAVIKGKKAINLDPPRPGWEPKFEEK
jgi:hypothetical protein